MEPGRGIRAHVAEDGCVHFARGREPPVNSGLLPSAFAARYEAESYHVLGLRNNASLLLDLAGAHDARHLFVGNPCVVPRQAVPAQVLDALLLVDGRQRWYPWALTHAATFSLTAHQYKQRILPAPLALLAKHPALPVLSFLAGLDRDQAIRLLVAIGDPRWYCNDRRPGRWSGLYSHLKLTPAHVRAYLQSLTQHQAPADLPAVAIWHRHGVRFGSINAPGNFLWRCFLGHSEHSKKLEGLLRTSARLARYVALYWLSQITEQREWRFHPEEFFKESNDERDEVAAFLVHERAVHV